MERKTCVCVLFKLEGKWKRWQREWKELETGQIKNHEDIALASGFSSSLFTSFWGLFVLLSSLLAAFSLNRHFDTHLLAAPLLLFFIFLSSSAAI
jgi:hypothetical protein